MLTAAGLLFQLAGAPPQGGEDHPAACAICGASVALTVEYGRWQGANFTDQNKGLGSRTAFGYGAISIRPAP